MATKLQGTWTTTKSDVEKSRALMKALEFDDETINKYVDAKDTEVYTCDKDGNWVKKESIDKEEGEKTYKFVPGVEFDHEGFNDTPGKCVLVFNGDDSVEETYTFSSNDGKKRKAVVRKKITGNIAQVVCELTGDGIEPVETPYTMERR